MCFPPAPFLEHAGGQARAVQAPRLSSVPLVPGPSHQCWVPAALARLLGFGWAEACAGGQVGVISAARSPLWAPA